MVYSSDTFPQPNLISLVRTYIEMKINKHEICFDSANFYGGPEVTFSQQDFSKVEHDGLFYLKMLQIAESFIHLTFSTTVYYFHQSFE